MGRNEVITVSKNYIDSSSLRSTIAFRKPHITTHITHEGYGMDSNHKDYVEYIRVFLLVLHRSDKSSPFLRDMQLLSEVSCISCEDIDNLQQVLQAQLSELESTMQDFDKGNYENVIVYLEKRRESTMSTLLINSALGWITPEYEKWCEMFADFADISIELLCTMMKESRAH